MKKNLLGLALLASVTVAQAQDIPAVDTSPGSSVEIYAAADQEHINLKQMAIAGAAGDSVSTYLALQSGGVELNNFVNTSPIGLLALAAVKWGVVEVIEASSMSPEAKKYSFRLMGSLWWGAVANNTLVALSAANPVSLAVGIATGLYVWHKDYKGVVAQPPEKLEPQVNQIAAGTLS